MIVTPSYFQYPPVFIPGASDSVPEIGTGDPTELDKLQLYIDKYEGELLINALGRVQYAELVSEIENGEVKPTANQKWIDLVNGKDDWQGLIVKFGQVKTSLIAEYIYYHYLRDTETFYATTGLVRPDAANSITISANVDLVTKWNDFVSVYEGNSICNFYHPNLYYESYPLYGNKSNFTSLRSFLMSNSDVFDTSFFNNYGFKNRHGL